MPANNKGLLAFFDKENTRPNQEEICVGTYGGLGTLLAEW